MSVSRKLISRLLENSTKYVVVTKQPELVKLLEERNIIPYGVSVVSQATASDVKGKNVIGTIPLSLARLAESVTEIPLNIPSEMKDKELKLETLREVAGEAITYKVNVI